MFFILPNPKFGVNNIWYVRRPDVSRYKIHSRVREIWYVGKHTSLTYLGIHCTLRLGIYGTLTDKPFSHIHVYTELYGQEYKICNQA